MNLLKELGQNLNLHALASHVSLLPPTKDFYLEYEMANEHVNMTIINITSWLP